MTTTTQDNRPFAHAFFVLLRHWRFLVFSVLLALIGSVVFALLMPNWYKATASFLPPQNQTGLLEKLAGGLSSTLRTIGISGLGQSDGVYSFVSILESRQIGEKIIKEFDLMKVYEIDDGSMENALKALKNNTEFTFEEDGLLAISVWDKDPKRAAEMANAFFAELNNISTTLNASEAQANRQYVQLQYESVRDSLTFLEQRFVAFQKRTKIYALPEQTEATLRAAGDTYAELSMLKVYLKMLEQRFGANDADVQNLRAMTKEMEKEIPGMSGNNILGLMGSSMDKLPDEALEYMRMYRDIETLSKLHAFLLPIYQQSVLDEHKQMTVLVPLDRASVPERKDRPKRSLIVLVAVMSVLILAVTYVIGRERFRFYRERYSDEWKEVQESLRFKEGKKDA